MPSLQIRELPEPIYYKLKTQATKEHRSLSQQAIICLSKGLDIKTPPQTRRHKLIENIRGNINIEKNHLTLSN